MKQQVIRLTESDLQNMVMNSVKSIIAEREKDDREKNYICGKAAAREDRMSKKSKWHETGIGGNKWDKKASDIRKGASNSDQQEDDFYDGYEGKPFNAGRKGPIQHRNNK